MIQIARRGPTKLLLIRGFHAAAAEAPLTSLIKQESQAFVFNRI